MRDSYDINRANWDERAPAHARSSGYGVDQFVADPTWLSHVVRFDRLRLGDLTGLRGLHLQCHIGTDTLSLARLGATMSGLDFSPASLEQARSLAERTGTSIDYHEANAYDAVEVFGAGSFDLVYTGIGAICWLPSISRWAEVVAGLLRPGGRLFIREGHPMLMTINEGRDGVLSVEMPYFEPDEPLAYEDDSTYVDTDVAFEHNVSHTWSHGLAEVITALMDVGMTLTMLIEHDSVPWNALPGLMVEDPDTGEWRLREDPSRLAATYTLQAVKPA